MTGVMDVNRFPHLSGAIVWEPVTIRFVPGALLRRDIGQQCDHGAVDRRAVCHHTACGRTMGNSGRDA